MKKKYKKSDKRLFLHKQMVRLGIFLVSKHNGTSHGEGLSVLGGAVQNLVAHFGYRPEDRAHHLPRVRRKR